MDSVYGVLIHVGLSLAKRFFTSGAYTSSQETPLAPQPPTHPDLLRVVASSFSSAKILSSTAQHEPHRHIIILDKYLF